MKRLQFEFPDEKAQEIDDLVEKTGLKTRAQLFNTALSLFEWAVRERDAGNIIAAVNERTDKYKELDMPGLPSPRRAGKGPILKINGAEREMAKGEQFIQSPGMVMIPTYIDGKQIGYTYLGELEEIPLGLSPGDLVEVNATSAEGKVSIQVEKADADAAETKPGSKKSRK